MSSESTPEVPGPNRQEREAMASQNALLDLLRRNLQQQGNESRYLQPLLFEELGLDPQYSEVGAQISGADLRGILGNQRARRAGVDSGSMYTLEDALSFAGGNEQLTERINQRFESISPTRQLTGLTRRTPSAQQTRAGEIERLSQERELAALRGELPLNPGLLSDLAAQQRELEQTMERQLGPGWATSTAGIEGMRAFNLMRNTALDNARRGDLTLADALQSNAAAMRQGAQGQFFGLSGAAGQLPFGNIGGFGQAAGGYGNMAQMLAAQRMAQFNALNSGGGGGGGVAGAFGSLAGIFGGSAANQLGNQAGTGMGNWMSGLFSSSPTP